MADTKSPEWDKLYREAVAAEKTKLWSNIAVPEHGECSCIVCRDVMDYRYGRLSEAYTLTCPPCPTQEGNSE